MKALYFSNLKSVPLLKRGKVRDIYDLGDRLLIVATDRISAFDVVLKTPIPQKGIILTQITLFWFDFFKDIKSHFIGEDIDQLNLTSEEKEEIRGRSIIVKKLEIFPVECVVRGYLAGSGWKEYKESNMVCGIRLPAGLKESSKLDTPIFTPATKATVGHDENIDFNRMIDIVGEEVASRLRDISLSLYKKAAEYTLDRGIILCDTKFEFGKDKEGNILLADEVLTPDSSRFWPKEGYEEGKSQPSFDKQFVRDYLLGLVWDKKTPIDLPQEIVEKTREKYIEALVRLLPSERKNFVMREYLQ